MKNDIKEKYLKQQKKQKIKIILKWVFCGLGWTALIGAFVGLVALGCKSCANKKVDSNNKTRIIGDYTLNKAVIEEQPYKYYYRYNQYDGFDSGRTREVVGDAQVRMKHLDNDTSGENGTYKTYLHFDLLVYVDSEIVECKLFGSETGTLITDYELLYQTTYDIEHSQSDIVSNIQLGFVDSSIDFKSYNGDNLALIYLSNIIKNNCVDNLNLSFDMNSQINRYAMLGQSNTTFGRIEGTTYLGSNWCIKGYFKDSLNNYYKGIKVTYAQANGCGYLDNSTNITSQMYKVFDLNGAQYINVTYVRTDNTEVIVNKGVWVQFDNKQCYTSKSEWVADSFRHLTIFYLDNFVSILPINEYSPLEVLQMFNNTTIGVDNIGLGDTNGVFGLLGQAFSSVASILNLQIIPGITLGLFIFIPFSIMILLACVWLFKR